MSDRRNTREYWLQQAVHKMRPMFKAVDAKLPEKIFVSVALTAPKVLGRCAEDEHVFISAALDDTINVLETLAHELVHVAVGNKHKHGKAFKRVARAIGLEGPLTATRAGEELREKLRVIIDGISFLYPHEALVLSTKSKRPPGGGWVKFESTHLEHFICRVSKKSFEMHGAPLDPSGEVMVKSRKRG